MRAPEFGIFPELHDADETSNLLGIQLVYLTRKDFRERRAKLAAFFGAREMMLGGDLFGDGRMIIMPNEVERRLATTTEAIVHRRD